MYFFLAFMLLLSVFKAASLDGHMAFLVAVHYVIFYWKFCMQVWRINSSILLLLLLLLGPIAALTVPSSSFADTACLIVIRPIQWRLSP